MTEQSSDTAITSDNIRIVENFLNALQSKDIDLAVGALDENVVYQNVGYHPAIRGRHRVKAILKGLDGRMRFEVKFHHSASDGAAVLNERTDALVFGPLRLQFWVCGVFEVHQGQITLWRDYVDGFDMLKGLARGVVGIVLPALRPRF